MGSRLVHITHTRATSSEPLANARGHVTLVTTGAANEATNVNQYTQSYQTDAAGEGYRVEPDGTIGEKGVLLQTPDEAGLVFYYRFSEPDGVSTVVPVAQGDTTTLRELKQLADSGEGEPFSSAYVPKDLSSVALHDAPADDDDFFYIDKGQGEHRRIAAKNVGSGDLKNPVIRYPDRRPEMEAATAILTGPGTVVFTVDSSIVVSLGADFSVLSPGDVIFDDDDVEYRIWRVMQFSLQLTHHAQESKSAQAFRYRKEAGLVVYPEALKDGWQGTDDTLQTVIWPGHLWSGQQRADETPPSFPSLKFVTPYAKGWWQVIERSARQGGGWVANLQFLVKKLDRNQDEDDNSLVREQLSTAIAMFGRDIPDGGIARDGVFYITIQHETGADTGPSSFYIRQFAIWENNGSPEIELRALTSLPSERVDRLWNDGGVVRITVPPGTQQHPRIIFAGTLRYDNALVTLIDQYKNAQIDSADATGDGTQFVIDLVGYPIRSETHFVNLTPSALPGDPGNAPKMVYEIDDNQTVNGRITVYFDGSYDPYQIQVQVYEAIVDLTPVVEINVPSGTVGTQQTWTAEVRNVAESVEYHWWESYDGGTTENYLGKTTDPNRSHTMPDGERTVTGRVEVHPESVTEEEPTEPPISEDTGVGIIHPEPPRNVVATHNHEDTITVTWDAPLAGVVDSYVAWLTLPDGTRIRGVSQIQALTIDLFAEHGGTFYVEVISTHNLGGIAGTDSNTVTVIQDPIADLSSPAKTDTTVDLAWTNPVGQGTIVGTVIYQDDVEIYNGSPLETYKAEGLTESTQYKFEVASVNNGGESAKSNAINVTTDVGTVPVVPGPEDLAAVAGQADVTLTWTNLNASPNNPTICRIYRDDALIDSPAWEGVGQQQYVDSDAALVAGQEYKYEVAYFNVAGDGPVGNSAFATPTGVPKVPALAVSGVGNESVSLTITPEGTGDEIGYLVEYSTDPDFGVSNEDDVGANLTPTITGLTNDVLTYFRARSYNIASDESANSNVVSDTPTAPAQVPHPRAATLLYFPQPTVGKEYDDATGRTTGSVQAGGAPAIVGAPYRDNVWQMNGSQYGLIDAAGGNPFGVIDASFISYIAFKKAAGTAATSMGFWGNGGESTGRAGMNFQITSNNARFEIEDNVGQMQKQGINTIKSAPNLEEWNTFLFYLDITGEFSCFANGMIDYRVNQSKREFSNLTFPITPFHSQGMALGNRRPPSASFPFNGELIVGFDAFPAGGLEELAELAQWWDNLRRGRGYADFLDNGNKIISSVYGGVRAVTVATTEAVSAKLFSFPMTHGDAPDRTYGAQTPVDGFTTFDMSDMPDGDYEARFYPSSGGEGWFACRVTGNVNTPVSYRSVVAGCMDIDGYTVGNKDENPHVINVLWGLIREDGGDPLFTWIPDDYHYADPPTPAQAAIDWKTSMDNYGRRWIHMQQPGLALPGNHELGGGSSIEHDHPNLAEYMELYTRTSPFLKAGGLTNLIRMPDGSLPYCSIVHGRIRWIFLETYSARGAITDRYISDTQRAQILADLTDSAAQGQVPILLSTHVWQGDGTSYGGGISGDSWDAYGLDKQWLSDQIRLLADTYPWFAAIIVCGDLHFSAHALSDLAGALTTPDAPLTMFLRGKIIHSFGGVEGGPYTPTPGNGTYPDGRVLGSPHCTVIDVTDNGLGSNLVIRVRNIGNTGWLEGLDYTLDVTPAGSPPAGDSFAETLNPTGDPIGGGPGFSDINSGP